MFIESSLDILYLSISFVIILVGLLSSTVLIQLVFILKDIAKITKKTSSALKMLSKYVFKPLAALHLLKELITPFLDNKKK